MHRLAWRLCSPPSLPKMLPYPTYHTKDGRLLPRLLPPFGFSHSLLQAHIPIQDERAYRTLYSTFLLASDSDDQHRFYADQSPIIILPLIMTSPNLFETPTSSKHEEVRQARICYLATTEKDNVAQIGNALVLRARCRRKARHATKATCTRWHVTGSFRKYQSYQIRHLQAVHRLATRPGSRP